MNRRAFDLAGVAGLAMAADTANQGGGTGPAIIDIDDLQFERQGRAGSASLPEQLTEHLLKLQVGKGLRASDVITGDSSENRVKQVLPIITLCTGMQFRVEAGIKDNKRQVYVFKTAAGRNAAPAGGQQ